jgi:hypothetical protein
MVGKKRGDVLYVGVLKLPKQPHQAPRIIAGLGADVGASDVGV